MADRDERGKSSCPLSKFSSRQNREAAGASSSSSSCDETDTTRRRCTVNRLPRNIDRSNADPNHLAGPDLSRREESPFSFKHFLKNNAQTNYQLAGARPKVYSPPATSPEQSIADNEAGVYTRNPTELPDFVQDHLIVEQCYLNHEATSQPILDLENLPDFALNSVEQRQPRHWNETKSPQSEVLRDLPVDLTGCIDRGRRERSASNVATPAPLDLPTFDRLNEDSVERSETLGFPFDLPLPPLQSNANNTDRITQSVATAETNAAKSLPDFLSDGPIRSRPGPSSNVGPRSSSPEPTERRLILENERLRHELEVARSQLEEKSRRIQSLELELTSRRAVDHEETAHLEKAMEQVEDNLKRSTMRAVNAESSVTALKQEIKGLTAEISILRSENGKLRRRLSTEDFNAKSENVDGRVRKVASDLRMAAKTAQVSLRQLMLGVDNLRVLASALENMDRIEDRTKDFLPDFEDDNAAGPAL